MSSDLKKKMMMQKEYLCVRPDGVVFPWTEVFQQKPGWQTVKKVDYKPKTEETILEMKEEPVVTTLIEEAKIEEEIVMVEMSDKPEDYPAVASLQTKDEAITFARSMFGVELDNRWSLDRMKKTLIGYFTSGIPDGE